MSELTYQIRPAEYDRLLMDADAWSFDCETSILEQLSAGMYVILTDGERSSRRRVRRVKDDGYERYLSVGKAEAAT